MLSKKYLQNSSRIELVRLISQQGIQVDLLL